ncbi:ComF family protein [Desulfonatronospira sp.]|uniref:ComF family protein n=1 Tax=Desulfonatronospira sp. TaxID=1962951 RepID=UPI0025C262EF|nr:ComF family protein [Desulfonatronospira sp.]
MHKHFKAFLSIHGYAGNFSWLQVRQYIRAFKSGFLGGRCLVCGLVMVRENRSIAMCSRCSGRLKIRRTGFCPGCARVYVLDEEEPYLCLDCRGRPFPWSGLGFFGAYQEHLRDLILSFKFQGDLGLGKVLGNMLVQAADFHGLIRADLVVPVPMHESKLKQRGFNQSLELARIFCAGSGLKLQTRALKKIKPTAAQSTLKRKDRLKELRGAFSADPVQVKGCSVLLVDDIFTTGSTLDECTRELRVAGASRVEVLFLARGVM